MERTCSNAFLRDSSWDCSRGKLSRSVRINLSIAFRSPGAASASPGSASPERTAASLPGFSFLQEASAHKTPNKTLKEGQLVPKISGCRRWGLTATSTLCFCPRNWMAKRTTGYYATSPCTHLTRTMQLISNASGWTRLWWIEVWLQPESTKAQYVPPLILTGIWYPPAWSGAACGASGTRTNVPTSITGQRSIKWPGSPQRQQAGPGFPATLVAGRGTRNWRGETGGTGIAAADPASLAWALAAVDSGAGPPLHRGWARGTTPARDLGKKVGGEKEGEGRERETDGRVSSTPWHATIWSSASWMARSSDAGRWHWTHCAVFVGSHLFPGQQPSAAGVPELVSHHEGPAVLPEYKKKYYFYKCQLFLWWQQHFHQLFL